MSKLNWNRGMAAGGGLAHAKLTRTHIGLNDWMHSGNKRQAYARAVLKRKASEGDGKAELTLHRINQRHQRARDQASAVRKAILGTPNFEPVAKGCKRIMRKDPETGEDRWMDLPMTKGQLDKILHLIAKHKPFDHIAPELTPAECEFIKTGRWE
jgi:hypothetical protein